LPTFLPRIPSLSYPRKVFVIRKTHKVKQCLGDPDVVISTTTTTTAYLLRSELVVDELGATAVVDSLGDSPIR